MLRYDTDRDLHSMNTIGRNDPCPCGSGKKYKKCHGLTVAPTPKSGYDRIRWLDAESANLLMAFAKRRYGDDAIEDAWEAFHFFDGTPFDLSGPVSATFLRWFVFDWKPEDEETLAELFLLEKGSQLDRDLCRFIEATLHAPYSFFQMLGVDPGVSLTLRDILRKREYMVTERSASTILQRGHILFARVVELDGISFLMGNGWHIIPPLFLDHLLHLRELLGGEESLSDGSVTSETLLNCEEDLREAYFEIVDELENQKLQVRNTDGDHLAVHTLTYEIPSFDEAFHALKDLEQKVSGCTDAELLAEATKTEDGEPIKVHLHWLKKGRNSGGQDITILGTLTISASTLVVDVNSEKRSKRIQKEIKKRLGNDAVLLRTEIKSQEGIFKEVAEMAKNPESNKDTEHDRLMRESPEARAVLKEMTKRHWASWHDTPLPALRGVTPRQAAKDSQGRELLESLLMGFDLTNRSKEDEFLRVDTAELRRKLGLESS